MLCDRGLKIIGTHFNSSRIASLTGYGPDNGKIGLYILIEVL